MVDRHPYPPASISHARNDNLMDEAIADSRLKAAGNTTIEGFFALVLRGLKWYQENVEKKPRELWTPMLMGYPQMSMDKTTRARNPITGIEIMYYLQPFVDLITYKVRTQQPGGLQGPFSSKRERTFHHRETVKNDENPQEVYDVYGRRMDNLVQFDIWGSNGRSAEARASWFMNVMQLITGSIMRQGVGKILFWGRLEDDTVTKWRSDVAVRSLRYYIRTEEIQLMSAGKIRGIDVYSSVKYSLDEAEDELAKAWLVAYQSGWILPDPSGLTFPWNANASGWPIAPAHTSALTGLNIIDED